jgi:ACS family sodium-dependent inorganic phosphate cotransporter-like MFS transporter 5
MKMIIIINSFEIQEADDNKFVWDEHEQNMILGSFFASMWITQIPGGILSQKYGTKKVFGFSQFSAVLVAFLLPWSARTGAWGLIIMRFFQGLLHVSLY